MKTNEENKLHWGIDYGKDFPVITCNDVVGEKFIIDINKIIKDEIEKEREKSLKRVDILLNLLKEKQKNENK